jgi:NADP-dependent 3-hydroxy acid dehydrogenase YdfG
VLGARRAERLADLATRITDAGGVAAYRPADVRHRAGLAALTGLATERYGRLDVMISNVGVAWSHPWTTCGWTTGTR